MSLDRKGNVLYHEGYPLFELGQGGRKRPVKLTPTRLLKGGNYPDEASAIAAANAQVDGLLVVEIPPEDPPPVDPPPVDPPPVDPPPPVVVGDRPVRGVTTGPRTSGEVYAAPTLKPGRYEGLRFTTPSLVLTGGDYELTDCTITQDMRLMSGGPLGLRMTRCRTGYVAVQRPFVGEWLDCDGGLMKAISDAPNGWWGDPGKGPMFDWTMQGCYYAATAPDAIDAQHFNVLQVTNGYPQGIKILGTEMRMIAAGPNSRCTDVLTLQGTNHRVEGSWFVVDRSKASTNVCSYTVYFNDHDDRQPASTPLGTPQNPNGNIFRGNKLSPGIYGFTMLAGNKPDVYEGNTDLVGVPIG